MYLSGTFPICAMLKYSGQGLTFSHNGERNIGYWRILYKIESKTQKPETGIVHSHQAYFVYLQNFHHNHHHRHVVFLVLRCSIICLVSTRINDDSISARNNIQSSRNVRLNILSLERKYKRIWIPFLQGPEKVTALRMLNRGKIWFSNSYFEDDLEILKET